MDSFANSAETDKMASPSHQHPHDLLRKRDKMLGKPHILSLFIFVMAYYMIVVGI